MSAQFRLSLGAIGVQVAGTTIDIKTTGPIAVGDFVVVRWVSDNINATTPTATCADGANIYRSQIQSARNATAGSGVAGGVFTTLATVARPAGTTITVTLSGSVVAKAAYAESFIGVLDQVRSAPVAAGGVVGASGGPTLPLATGAVQAGDLVLGCASVENRSGINADTDTLHGPWSTQVYVRSASAGALLSCAAVAGQYKIATAPGVQTFDASAAANSEWLTFVVVMQGLYVAVLNDADALYLGDVPIQAAYVGAAQVWSG